ncbi:MAG: terminase gpA endonuclease subunit [Candidatus Sedimenticola sp. (ex Thyasira tokunagai)]
MERVAEKLTPLPDIPTRQWAKEYFRLPEEGADLPGRYNPDYVPYMWGIFHALDNPAVSVVVLQKAAQIGWTFALIAFLGKRVTRMPSAILMLFPKDGAGRDFEDEKLIPSIKASPELADVMDVSTSRKAGNRAGHKKFAGGFLKMVGSNSASSVKSTPSPLVIVEEPDDTNDNVKDQGDAIRLARERLKRFRRSKMVLGGTPAVKGLSRIEENINISDQRVLPIVCHDCGDVHVLNFEHVKWIESETGPAHPVFGRADPDSAVYVCPHCGSAWDDWQRQQNILNTCRAADESGDPWCGWVPTVETSGGVVGFKELNELYVCMPGTSLADVVRDYLEAEHDAANGDESARIVFQNSKLGRPYEYRGEQADEESLRDAALDYREMVVPDGGLLITASIDVQHDRLALTMRVWGRGEASWLLTWRELATDNTAVDKNDAVWTALDEVVFSAIPHVSGMQMFVSAVSIDSSDGATNDAVYHWVRTRQKRHRRVLIMAVKGSSMQQDPEIFSTPRAKSIDHRNPNRQTKADRHGVKVYIVGTNKAKDWLAGQLKLEATGSGRFHFFADVRDDYYKQITSEVKAPHRSIRNRRVWQLKSGRRNEALDCEVYGLHAARALRVHLMTPEKWDDLEHRLMQADLFTDQHQAQEQTQTPAKKRDRAALANKLNG